MRVPHLVCVLCTVFGASSSLSALDREAFTITKYDLQIELEPEQHRLGARGKVRLRNDSAQSQKNAVLQISSSLDWRSIRIDGKTVQFVSQPYASAIDHTGALTEAIVTLPAEIKSKDSVEVEIGYEGTIALDTTRLTDVGVPDEIARRTSWDQIGKSFTAVRGAGYVAWYPIATESADFSEGNSLFQVVERWTQREALAAMTIHLCTHFSSDQPPYILMNGRPREGVSAGVDGHACSVHRFDQLGTVVPVFLTGEIKPKAPITGAAWVNIFFVPGREASASNYETLLESTTPFVTEWFGAPKTPITIADVTGRAGPFESGTLLLTAMESRDPRLEQTVLVHELVHSAFSSPRPWIDEGLAHFAEALYREKQDGRPAAIVLLGAHRAALVESESEVPASPQGDPGRPLATTFDEAYYRSKAAYVWWMLRDMVGGDALKQAIHNYRAADDRDPKYIEQLVEASSKRDLGWFFDDWVYHDRGLPDFHVQAAHPWKDEKGVQIVTVTIENAGSAGAEVPIAIHFADGIVVRRLEVRGRSSATMRIEVPGATTQVVVNDGSIPESNLDNNVFKIPSP
jgi:hypothetical protein